MKYEIYSGNAANITDSIERGLLDIGLMGEPIDIRKFDFVSMPVREETGALVPEDSEIAHHGFITPEDFTGAPVIAPRKQPCSRQYQKNGSAKTPKKSTSPFQAICSITARSS